MRDACAKGELVHAERLHLQVILCLESAFLQPLNYIGATVAHRPNSIWPLGGARKR